MALKVILAFVVLGLVSCATTKVAKIQGPDGTENLLISCVSVEYCYSEATKLCNGGKYKIVNTSTDTSSLSGESSTSTITKLLVKCEAGS